MSAALPFAAAEPAAVDLAAYAARIGCTGALRPDLETLRALTRLQPAAIPFEAIDVLLGRGVELSPAAVEAKLIGRHRGGYCFEQNGLLKRALEAIGFEVEGLLARVRWMALPGARTPPRSHMVLRVTIDGVPWLADVGFGSCVPTAPLRMEEAGPQPTEHEMFRLVTHGRALMLQALIDGEWQPVYELFPEPQEPIDFEVANWFTSTSPSSHFRHRLIVTRTTPEARLTLLDGRLTIRPAGGQAERRQLGADGIERALAELFGLEPEPAWRPALERAALRTESE